jgi:2-polyprenyl-3-methyl-5-hydroxy-6-metoxy-1,4-benzoquinol methylase
MSKPVDPLIQRQVMTRKLEGRMACEGKFVLPAVPALASDYTARCEQLFSALGRKLNPAERDRLHEILAGQLQQAFDASQRSSITITYEANVHGLLNYVVSPNHTSIATTYEGWVSTRQPPYFGVAPDAKVMAVATEAAVPSSYRVLDIGAGTGRNALALARLGHPVDAVEVTPKFAAILTATAQQECLDIKVICKDVFELSNSLKSGYDLILLSEVVSDFRSVEQLRAVFELAAQQLAPGGALLFNAFVSQPNYSADDAIRQFAQQVYACIFTPEELILASSGLALALVSDEGVHDYEKAHLPTSGWPPTGWYSNWVLGLDVFQVSAEDCPISLRWLVYRKPK